MKNANLHRILHCFQVIADYWSNVCFQQGYLSLTHLFEVNPETQDYQFWRQETRTINGWNDIMQLHDTVTGIKLKYKSVYTMVSYSHRNMDMKIIIKHYNFFEMQLQCGIKSRLQ